MYTDKYIICMIACLLLALIGMGGHADGWFDYPAEEWHEGVIIECDYGSYYDCEMVGNALVGYHYEDVYQGTYQILVIDLLNDCTLHAEYQLPRCIEGYDIPSGSKVKFRQMKRPLDSNTVYFEIQTI